MTTKWRPEPQRRWRAANPEKGTELELRIIGFKPGHERWEQPEVFSYLTSEERSELMNLIQRARSRKDAGKRPAESEEHAEFQTPPATSNGQEHMPSPVATTPASWAVASGICRNSSSDSSVTFTLANSHLILCSCAQPPRERQQQYDVF